MPRWLTSRTPLVLTLASIAIAAATLVAQDAPRTDGAAAASATESSTPLRLFEQEPYDLLRFKDGKEVQVQLLPLKTRRLPDKPRAADKLIVRTLEEPDTEYEVAWGDIDLQKTRLFEQLVLEEAERLVAFAQFNEAYDYYHFLEHYYARMPGLEESVQKYLVQEARHYQEQGQFDQSLALLNEAHRRNPQRAELPQALGAATSKLVEQRLAKDDYPSARRLVRSLLEKYPQNTTGFALVASLSAKAQQQIDEAKTHLAAARYREAADAARASMRVWPLEEGRRLLAEAHQKFPRVVVGVSVPAGSAEADPLLDWGARRSARLFNRRLLEFSGYGPQGGLYRCPVGEMERLDLGVRMLFRLRPETPWSDGQGVLTGHDVARRLLQMADPAQPTFRADWAELLKNVSVPDVYEVDLELRRAHVHPDGMLQTILTPWDSGAQDGRTASIGPYVVDAVAGDHVRYLANQLYFAANDTQPREIVERWYPVQRQAVQALVGGELAVLDRVLPWEVETLGATAEIAVERYAVPTIHCLIPNLNQPILARRSFRRALLYAINREETLRSQLLRGAPATLGQVVSGPFPRGETLDDAVGYAYNDDLAPYAYDPRHALILIGLARQELAIRAAKEAEAARSPSSVAPAAETKVEAKPATDLPPLPKLVLAHPPHDIARVACRAIEKQLEIIKLDVELKELSPNSLPSGDWDLLFAELSLWEPVIDARRLLGPQGLAGSCTPYMDLTLRQLGQADDWKRVREKLLEVHLQTAKDLPLLPLWQLVDHFAYQKKLEGIGKRPAMLYQNIESWRAPPWFTAEAL